MLPLSLASKSCMVAHQVTLDTVVPSVDDKVLILCVQLLPRDQRFPYKFHSRIPSMLKIAGSSCLQIMFNLPKQG